MKAIQKTMTKTKIEIGCQEQHCFLKDNFSFFSTKVHDLSCYQRKYKFGVIFFSFAAFLRFQEFQPFLTAKKLPRNYIWSQKITGSTECVKLTYWAYIHSMPYVASPIGYLCKIFRLHWLSLCCICMTQFPITNVGQWDREGCASKGRSHLSNQ